MIKIERVVSWYGKDTDELVSEKNIDSVQLEILREIFSQSAEDPLMYRPYNIMEKEGRELSRLIELKFDFDKYVYQLECFQI